MSDLPPSPALSATARLCVRAWWFDHWGRWIPASGELVRGISPAEWEDLKREGVITRHNTQISRTIPDF